MSNKGNQVISGTNGTVWVNGEQWLEVKSFDSKITGQFEDINFAGDYATYSKYQGWNGEGSITTLKVRSRGAKIMAEAFKTGIMPEIKIIGKLDDPQAYGAERVVFEGVSFTEFSPLKFENRANVEEELPFKFSKYDYIEMI